MSNAIFTTVLLPLALVIIMTSLGVALTVQDFKRVLVYPKGVAIGMANLLVVAPALAFGLAYLFRLPPELAVGVVLLGCAPGGTMANMLTHLARGDTALAVTMTAVSSALSVITIPIFLSIAMRVFMDSSQAPPELTPIVVKILMITLAPLSFGMAIRGFFPVLAGKLEKPLKALAIGFFVLVVIAAIYGERHNIWELIQAVGAAVITLNVAAMSISYGSSRFWNLDSRQSTAVAIELGVHNTTLSMAVGGMVAMAMTIPGAVYGVFMFVTAGLFAYFMARRNAVQPSGLSETRIPSASA